jgi:hypothetical protein
MSSSCVRHPMATAEHVCSRCGHDHCAECVVHPFGPSRPSLCVGCALAVGGVRSSARHSAAPRRQVRTKLRAARRAAASAAQATRADDPGGSDPDTRRPAELEWISDADEDLPGGWHVTF